MKISNISQTGSAFVVKDLKFIFGESKVVVASPGYKLPNSYIFIESIIDNNLFNEAGLADTLKQLGQVGTSYLKSKIAPGPSADIEQHLQGSGGIEKINDLIRQAGQQKGNILDNQNWLNELYSTFL